MSGRGAQFREAQLHRFRRRGARHMLQSLLLARRREVVDAGCMIVPTGSDAPRCSCSIRYKER
jgi:hypothetical protein